MYRHQKRTPRKSIVIAAAVLFVMTIVGVSNFVFNLPEPTEPTEPVPNSWFGTWQTVEGSVDMVATVSKNKIDILWETEEGSAIYWSGTFPTVLGPSEGATVLSNANKEALEFSILASQDSEKLFTLEDGYLTYPFSALGMTKTVRLKKK
jgi:hypothetical protein